MDFRIIINCIIIIFILHIILLNINYSIDLGNKNKIESFTDINENSISFLTETNNNKDDEFKKKLMKFIKEDEFKKENEFENKNIKEIEASNSYLSNNNVPNFESNVADVSKFYNINYDNLDENKLKSTSIETLSKIKNELNIEIPKINDLNTINTNSINSNKSCDENPFGRNSTENPDTWNYKNELPMNGGAMNGIFGFDSLESQFAIYNPNKLTLETVDDNKFKNIPHDDLRKPIIYEN
jgi:hypothetical protein